MKCDMTADCTNAVTHIGNKGFVYCATHAACRQGYERCRILRRWEMAELSAGRAISYTRGSKPQELSL